MGFLEPDAMLYERCIAVCASIVEDRKTFILYQHREWLPLAFIYLAPIDQNLYLAERTLREDFLIQYYSTTIQVNHVIAGCLQRPDFVAFQQRSLQYSL